jgi:tetratricopeptide (TPR) repeat protein
MAETLEERWTLEAQTARNLEAMDAEHAGRLEDAIGLYERNVAEGFPGDLPYGRLVAIYEKRGAFDEAQRVLQRAIAVFETSTRRTAQDRRAMLRVFRKRLTLVRKAATRRRPSRASPAESGSAPAPPGPPPTAS